MLRLFANFLALLLIAGMAMPVSPAEAGMTHLADPAMPMCKMADGCCDMGLACAATCDRCLAVVPQVTMPSARHGRPVRFVPHISADLVPHRHTLEPPVPRFS